MTVKTFILHDDAAVHRMVAYLRERRKKAADSGHPLQVTIAPFHPTRSAAQVRAMWGFILRPTAMQARVGGLQYKPDVWHVHLMRELLPEQCAKGVEKWRLLPNGERELQMTTGDLNEQEMDTFLMECRAYVAQELGVELPARDDDQSAQRQADSAE